MKLILSMIKLIRTNQFGAVIQTQLCVAGTETASDALDENPGVFVNENSHNEGKGFRVQGSEGKY